MGRRVRCSAVLHVITTDYVPSVVIVIGEGLKCAIVITGSHVPNFICIFSSNFATAKYIIISSIIKFYEVIR